MDGFEYAGVRREQNATYLAKVVSALYTDDFSSQGLGVELPEKTTALGKCYLIGVKLDIPAMRRAALEKLKGLERLYTDSGVILDVMELVYGKQEMVEEEFRMWLGDMGEYIFGASEETLVEIHSGEVGRRVEQLIIEGGDLGIDLEGLRERYRGGNVRPEASRAVESLVAVRERYSIESSRPRGPRVPAEVDELPDDSQEVNSLEII